MRKTKCYAPDVPEPRDQNFARGHFWYRFFDKDVLCPLRHSLLVLMRMETVLSMLIRKCSDLACR